MHHFLLIDLADAWWIYHRSEPYMLSSGELALLEKSGSPDFDKRRSNIDLRCADKNVRGASTFQKLLRSAIQQVCMNLVHFRSSQGLSRNIPCGTWQLARTSSIELLRSVDGKILRINHIWQAGWLQINKKFHMGGTRTLPRQSTRTKAPQPISRAYERNVVIMFCREQSTTLTLPRHGLNRNKVDTCLTSSLGHMDGTILQ